MFPRIASYRCVALCSAMILLSRPMSALPDDTRSAPLPLEVREVAPGVYVHQGLHAEATPWNLGGIANIGFIVGDEAVAVIDTGGSYAEGAAFLAAIRRITSLPVRYVISTHFHPDHLLGNAAFLPPAVVVRPMFIAHANLPRDLMARRESYLAAARDSLGVAFAGTDIVMPQHLIRLPETIDLGHRPLLLTPYPPAHSDADLTVRDMQTATLFSGDLLFVDRVPAVDGSITGWLKVLDSLQSVSAVRAVPGHGPVSVSWPSAIQAEQHYLADVVAATRQALRRNRGLEQTVEEVDGELRRTDGPNWQLFDAYDGRNITAAYTELEWE